MSAGTGHDVILDRLRSILATGKLPGKAAQSVETLIKRLESAVRLVLMGPPGGGKSTLANILIGAEVIPQDLRLPTTEIRFAADPSLEATLTDGSRRRFAADDFDALQESGPAMVEIRAPVPALRRFSVLELVTDGSPAELSAAARWAARRADMVMWVTPEFRAAEQKIWQAVPEALKHHAFLVQSLLDRHSLERQDMLRQMPQTAAGSAFLGMFPVSALQVAVAIDAGVADIAGVMKVSGCTALKDALDKRLEIGRQADLDAAEYFLARYGDLAAAPVPAPEPAPMAASVAETASPATDAAALEPAAPAKRRPLSGLLGAPGDSAAGPAPAAPSQRRPSGLLRAVAMEEASAAPVDARGILDAALAALRDGANGMLADLEKGGAGGDILTRCTAAMDTLADLAQGAVDLEEIVAQAADVVLLLNLEQGESAAEDAVCALLQLKKEFEVCVAA